VLFLIRALSLGGAERQLVLIAEGLARHDHRVEVVTFYRGLPALEGRLERQGVRVIHLRKRGRADVLGFLRSLSGAVREFSPDAVYSFLPTANVVSALAIRRISPAAIVWGVRSSSVNLPGYDWLGRTIARAERWLRKSPDGIICNSQSGRDLYRDLGFSVDKLSIARNILDLDANRFDADARDRVRRSLGVEDSMILVGAAGRIDPVKGFDMLMEAFAGISVASKPIVLAIAGDGPADYRQKLESIAAAAGISERVKWMGRVDDMKGFYSALDIFCSSSIGAEATSNVVAEALACERLTIATRVGDSPDLIDDASLLARPGDPESLREVLMQAIGRLATWDGARARARVAGRLSADVAIDETERALARAMNSRHPRTSDTPTTER
jgi:glycosyltransferase involved in cell wall biosynthesis